MATPNARRRALDALMVGAPPDLASRPADLFSAAPDMPQGEQEGLATEHLYSSPEPADELAALRQRSAIGNLMADLGQSTSRGIETLTGASGGDVFSGMRTRASEPLKDYMRLQEQRRGAPLKPTKSTDPKSPESQRAQAIFKQAFPSEDASSITESNLDVAMRTMLGVRGQEGIAGRSAADVTQRALDREQRAAEAAAREGRLWSEMSQEERLARLRIEEAREARETAAAARREEQIAGSTERLGGELDKTGAPKFFQQYDEAKTILKKYPKDLPGLGRVDGRLPDEALTPDGRQLRFLVGQLLSEYRKGQTGAGMSDAERDEYAQITGLLYSGNDAAVRQGLDTLKRAIDARVAAIKGGFRPEAVKTYEGRVPSLRPKATKPTQPKRVTPQQAMPTDAAGNPTLDAPEEKIPMIAPDGTRKLVPKSRVDAALKAGGRLVNG